MAPQLFAQDVRQPAPGAQVVRGLRVAAGAARAAVARAVQPVQGQQAAQAGEPLRIVTVSGPGAVERHVVHCAVHGALSAHFRLVDARRVRRCVWCEGGR